MSRDLHVIACVENAANAALVIPWARYFAERLNHKGLFALHVEARRGNDSWLHDIGIPYISLQGDWSTAIDGLPTAFGGILAVTAVDPKASRTSLTHPHTLLQQFKGCKIAYLVVSKPFTTPQSLLSALTMTHHREGKEKLVWASYLARFLNSTIAIAHPDYRDSGLRGRWRNNMRFADKMFEPFGIHYTTPIITRQTRVDLAALDELKPDLLIARTTDQRERDLFDLLSPRPELRLLTHPSHTPMLFLNPRDDLYIICD